MTGKYFIAVAVALVCLANFASFTDAAYTFGTHTTSDCSDSTMIAWAQGFAPCSAEKKRSIEQGYTCYAESATPSLWYSFRECTLQNEEPVSAPPAGWLAIKYSESPNCEFSSSNNWTAIAVNQTGTLVKVLTTYAYTGATKYNITMTCQSGILSASACDDYLNTCFKLDNVAENQCVNATSGGVSNSWSGTQMGCQAPPKAAPVATAPVTSSGPAANSPAKKTNSATASVANSILTVGLVASSYLFA